MNHETQITLDKFVAVLRDLAETAGQIARIEQAKAEAASENRHERLDDFIQDEQAYILKLRGQEQHRLRLAEQLGWKDLTFRQILASVEGEQEQLLSPLFAELERELKRLEQARGSSERIINAKLREIQVSIARQQGGSYDNTGNVSPNPPLQSKMHNKYV